MDKFNRRRLLLTALGAGILGRTGIDYWWNKIRLQEDLSEETLRSELNILEAAYTSEKKWQEQLKQIKAISNSVNLARPKIPYNKEVSKRLIQCCKLAVQQYRAGNSNPSYDGALQYLPTYNENFRGYTQTATFLAEEEIIEEYFKVELKETSRSIQSPFQKEIDLFKRIVEESLPKIFQGHHRRSVFIGYVLTSKKENIIVFRGTQTRAEWLKNMNSKQQKYINPGTNEFYGWIHSGFLSLATEIINPLPSSIAQQLDPSIPCYFTGHSLGAAVATISALDIALKNPQLSKQIRLYTYAGPRVGDPIFAKKFSQLLPNSYRVINLADSVPLVPPSQMGKSYLHVGEKWSFLTQFEEVLLNHIVDTYREAIELEIVIPN